jgi:hypothetical protein
MKLALSAKTKAHLWVLFAMSVGAHSVLTLPLSIKNPTKLVQHMGAHILLDSKMERSLQSLRLLLEYWRTMLDLAGKGERNERHKDCGRNSFPMP